MEQAKNPLQPIQYVLLSAQAFCFVFFKSNFQKVIIGLSFHLNPFQDDYLRNLTPKKKKKDLNDSNLSSFTDIRLKCIMVIAERVIQNTYCLSTIANLG